MYSNNAIGFQKVEVNQIARNSESMQNVLLRCSVAEIFSFNHLKPYLQLHCELELPRADGETASYEPSWNFFLFLKTI